MPAFPTAFGVAYGLASGGGIQGGVSYSPAAQFAAGAQGGWWDPSDITTLFQDSAGTTPVTASGQPVGRMLDKSGRGNHLVQTTAGSRPTYTEAAGLRFLAFDGVDDFLVSGANVPFTATDEVTTVVAMRKLSDATINIVAELSASFISNAGAFLVATPGAPLTATYLFSAFGTAQGLAESPSIYAAPHSAITIGQAKISTDLCQVRINGSAFTTTALDMGTGNFGSYLLYVGRRGGLLLPFGGNLYGMIMIGRVLTLPEVVANENYLKPKTGITF